MKSVDWIKSPADWSICCAVDGWCCWTEWSVCCSWRVVLLDWVECLLRRLTGGLGSLECLLRSWGVVLLGWLECLLHSWGVVLLGWLECLLQFTGGIAGSSSRGQCWPAYEIHSLYHSFVLTWSWRRLFDTHCYIGIILYPLL